MKAFYSSPSRIDLLDISFATVNALVYELNEAQQAIESSARHHKAMAGVPRGKMSPDDRKMHRKMSKAYQRRAKRLYEFKEELSKQTKQALSTARESRINP